MEVVQLKAYLGSVVCARFCLLISSGPLDCILSVFPLASYLQRPQKHSQITSRHLE